MCSDFHKIIFSDAPVLLIAMMITGLATRDRLCQRFRWRIIPLDGSSHLSYQLRRAGLRRRTGWRALGPAPAMISWPALRSAFDDQQSYCPWCANSGEAAWRPVCVRAVLLLEALPEPQGTGALKVVDLAGVKINQPQPWTPTTHRLGWSQGTDVRRVLVLPRSSAALGRVPVSRPFAGHG